MFGQIANIVSSMVAGIHAPLMLNLPILGPISPLIGAALIGLLPSLWQILFGGGNEPTTQDLTQTVVTPPWQPKDPGYNILSPYLLSMLTQNLGRTSGLGWPGGKGIGGDMTQQLLAMLSKSWPNILGNAAGKNTSLIRKVE